MNAHLLGFPRMGLNRELKWGLEKYWKGEATDTELLTIADELKKRHWGIQADAGLDLLPVGDFSLYDHVLDTIAMLGAVPERFDWNGKEVSLETYFHMARGYAEQGIPAMEMTKWFDSNYHYIVPELSTDMTFRKTDSRLLADVQTVRKLGLKPKPVIVGPITFLMLAKEVDECNRWDLLDSLTDAYCDIITELDGQCSWIQIDEPALCMDLSAEARKAFGIAFAKLRSAALPASS